MILNNYDLFSRITKSEYLTRTGYTFAINRTDGNSISCLKVQAADRNNNYTGEIINVTQIGTYRVTIPVSANLGYIYIGFNGSAYNPKMTINLMDLPYDDYILEITLTKFSSPNGEFVLQCNSQGGG